MPRTASLAVIERKIAELEKKAEEIQRRDKPGIKQLKALMAKYRLTHQVVNLALNGKSKKSSSPLAGKTLKPKYRNPGNKTETWSGRGLQPRWLVAAMKETGKKLDHFEI